MIKKLMNFFKDEEGATMVEYGLMVALVAIFLIGAIGVMAGGLDTLFKFVGTTLTANAN